MALKATSCGAGKGVKRDVSLYKMNPFLDKKEIGARAHFFKNQSHTARHFVTQMRQTFAQLWRFHNAAAPLRFGTGFEPWARIVGPKIAARSDLPS